MALADPVDLAPVLPASVLLVVAPHACPPATDATLALQYPASYTVAVAYADAVAAGDSAESGGGGDGEAQAGGSGEQGTIPGQFGLRDTVAAVFTGGGAAPDNAANLQALALQLAGDFYGWRSVRFDRSYAGIVAIPPDGTIDAITWGHDEWGPWTRVRSAPLGDEPADFNHADPSDLPPGFLVFNATQPPTVSNGTLVLKKERVAVVDGGRRFRTTALGTYAIPLCPTTSSSTMAMTTEDGQMMTTE